MRSGSGADRVDGLRSAAHGWLDRSVSGQGQAVAEVGLHLAALRSRLAEADPARPLAALDDVLFQAAEPLTAALAEARRRSAEDAAAALSALDVLTAAREQVDRLRSLDDAGALRARLEGLGDQIVPVVGLRGAEPLAAIARASLSPARPGSRRYRVSRRLGRDRYRRFRRGADGTEHAWRQLMVLATHGDALPPDALRALAGEAAAYTAAIRREHAVLTDGHAALAALGLPVGPPPAPPRPVTADGWTIFGPATPLRAAAATAVLPLDGDPHRFGLRAPHALRDLATAWSRNGFAVSLDSTAHAASAGWTQWLQGLQDALSAWRSDAWNSTVEPYTTWRDDAVGRWTRDYDHALAAAETVFAVAMDQAEYADRTADEWDRLCSEWTALLRPGPSGLSDAVRGRLALLASAVPRPSDPLTGRHLHPADTLRALAENDVEVRVPIVATLNAGKSTLLSALLGADLAPRRSYPMTAVATGYELDADARRPTLTLPPALVAEHRRVAAEIGAVPDGGLDRRLVGWEPLRELAVRLRTAGPLPATSAGAEAVRTTLAVLNDTARLALMLFDADTGADTGADAGADTGAGPDPDDPRAGIRSIVESWSPRVRVPYPFGTGSPPGLRLVLVDTPGIGESALAAAVERIARRALSEAHAAVFVLDYTQLGGAATATAARLVVERFGAAAPDAVWTVVNRIDQRRTEHDLSSEGTRAAAARLLGAADDRGLRVLETAAHVVQAVAEHAAAPGAGTAAAVWRLTDPLADDAPADPAVIAASLDRAARRFGPEPLRRDVVDALRGRGARLAVERALAVVAATWPTAGPGTSAALGAAPRTAASATIADLMEETRRALGRTVTGEPAPEERNV